MTRTIITGASLVIDSEDISSFSIPVAVTITDDGNTRTAKTNNYGDFEVEGLAKDTDYVVKINHPGYRTVETKTRIMVDIYLGDIILNKI